MDSPVLQGLERFLSVHVIVTAIPHHHGATAVVSFRDYALESLVIEGVIFDFDCKMFFATLPGQPLRHRPRLQDSIHLKPEIVMQSAGVMFLNDEPRRA